MKAQAMKLAHSIAKSSKTYTIFNNYRKAFRSALKKAWQIVKAEAVQATGLAKECVELVLRNLDIKPSSKQYAQAVEAINKVAKPEHFKNHGLNGLVYVSSTACDTVEDAVCDILGW